MDGESGPLTAAFAPTSGLPALVDQVTGLPKHSVEHLLGQPALLREARSGQLSNHFADGEVVGDLYTPRYYEILKLTNDPIYASRGWLLLRREHQAQKDRLTAVHAELTGLKQFTSHPGHIVISDTSALVEGVWLQKFDWRAAVARGPAVRLVIPIWSSRNLTASKTATATTLAPVPARSFASCANCGGGYRPASQPPCRIGQGSPSRSSWTAAGTAGGPSMTTRSSTKRCASNRSPART
jgi:hypothetical protein